MGIAVGVGGSFRMAASERYCFGSYLAMPCGIVAVYLMQPGGTMADGDESHEKQVWGLADALTSLRDDLIRAQDSGAGQSIHFEVEHIDLDLQLVASSQADGGVKLGWGVLSANLGGKLEAVRTHRLQIRLKLSPNQEGAPHQISDHEERPEKR